MSAPPNILRVRVIQSEVKPPSKKLKFLQEDEMDLEIPNELITYLQEKPNVNVDPLDY
jgi:hypothetical protein